MTEQLNDLQAELSPAQDLSIDTSVAAQPQAEPEVQEPNGFVQLGLADELVKAVADLGYTQPTAVQSRTIPLALPADDQEHHGYNDLMVSSQTGSGKTAAFLLPVLHTLIQQQAAAEAQAKADYDQACADAIARGEEPPKRARRKDPTNPRHFKAAVPGALVLCPTRELAQQVAHDAIELVKHCRGLRIANVVGGIPYQIQIAKLQNANLVVATPGRLLDLQRSMQIKLNEVQFLVVDEADRMLDLGFSDDLAEINQLTEQRRQTMMFSATFAPRIQQLAMRVMHDGGSGVHKVQIDSPQEKHANIKQVLFWADNAEHKRQLLDHWLRDASIDQAIVFASTQIECDGLATELQQAGFAAVALHGALSQGLRNRRLMALRNGQVQILVATDVAARGIDVPTITHVFNFGLPMKAEDYTHRIGRTGRAGRSGLAVTFAEIRDRRKIGDIEFYTKQPFTAEVIPGLEPKQRFDYPRKTFGGKGSKGGRSDRGERGFGGQTRGWGNRGGDRFEGQSRGGDFRGNDFRGGERFEPRFDARKDGGRQEPRFEARHDPRFEQRPSGGFQSERPHGERFERRDDRAPRSFDRPQHAPRAQARTNDRFNDRPSRGPKQVGGGFKPHAPKRRA
jgi:superfamily II DNA/RNA helicase